MCEKVCDDSLLSFLINSLQVENAHADILMFHSNAVWPLPPEKGTL